ncbi:S-adenosyl-L-methionine-dependent methyltransferase [Pseudovirgaria hyperparasitica]|uniref:S-adenosyl-L-methionine-dependent methyltransferase n=1 Tax=Pseudovirgaria hyperparasitica TaxID=470096 RepID=A0A6A6W891_9PEZI|nr:S-adenosyl-L-methionine-dependent methyltransferase [Pseudovirgaria hyperparasitica]KAF2758106.1 S-adenosyl-L-methionine-dependent methyltransferase [Pseudovirgaria hyperparasitica]
MSSLTIPPSTPLYDDEPPSPEEGPPSPRNIIEPDSDLSDNGHETGSCDTSTKSVRESIFNFIKENGRTYHAYQAGSYLFPNDPPELERLDLQFEILKVLFGGRNHFAPLENPRKILDIGTGTGKWAVQMAKKFPNAEVTGTDLSPIQPMYYPANCKFIIDDAAEPDWMIRPSSLDYVHTRVLLGAFTDFREIIKKAYHSLRPGGYLESQEMYSMLFCDDGTMPPNYPLLVWQRRQDGAAMDAGRPMRIANKLKRWYEQAGFVDVKEEMFKLPINSWPKDPQFKMLGRFSEQNLLDGLQGFSLAWFSRVLRWTKDEIEVDLVNVRKAISDRSVHAYLKIYVVWGRKPYPNEVPRQS